jgi:hypothetical protein
MRLMHVLAMVVILALGAVHCSSSAITGDPDAETDPGASDDPAEGDLADGLHGDGWVKDTPPGPDMAEPEPEPVEQVVEPEPQPEPADVVEVPDEVQPACPEDEPCDDDDPCTSDDTCTDNACVGLPYTCDDELMCTTDTCLGDGECEFTARPGFCFIADVCWWEGDVDPDNPCQECLSAVSGAAWSNDDTNECAEPGICVVYHCDAGQCLPGPKSCDDGNECTVDACQPAVGCTHTPTEGACDDRNVCTLGDFCYGGTCQPGLDSLACDDGNACTNDTCGAKLGCQHLPNSEPCDDASICTTNDHCAEGTCGGDPIDCSDGNPCTDDKCFPQIGCFPVDNHAPCDDGDFCTTGDTCVGGTCVSGTGAPPCDDGNACTDDLCDPQFGCYQLNNYMPCNDENVCTLGDHCLDGSCKAGKYQIFCYDSDPCTSDVCDPVAGCNYPPNGSPCDDHNVCTSGDFCGEGGCVGGEERLDCDDDDACTNDFCNPVDGCYHEWNEAWCEDDDPCTGGDKCLAGQCLKGTEHLVCDDGEECTSDSCVVGIGCVFTPIEVECTDHNKCTPVDQCVAGDCQGFGTINCDDGNDCTEDSCQPANGCHHEPLETAECLPDLVITYPPRGSQILDTTEGPLHAVIVTGYVRLPASPMLNLKINNEWVQVKPDGTFAHQMLTKQGLNIIKAVLRDKYYHHDEVVQTFQVSGKYYAPTEAVPNSLGLLLAQQVFDDDDEGTLDDLAAIATRIVRAIDFMSFVPNPVVAGDFAWCDYSVRVKNLILTIGNIDIQALDDYLLLTLKIHDVGVPIDVKVGGFLCSLASTGVMARVSLIEVNIALRPVLDADGVLKIEKAWMKYNVEGLDLQIDNDLVDLVYGFLNLDLPAMIAEIVDTQLEPVLTEMLNGIASSLVLDQDVEVPLPIPGFTEPLKFHLSAKPGYVQVVEPSLAIGYTVDLSAAEKGTPYELLGSPSNSNCLYSAWSPHDFKHFQGVDELNIGVWDDVLNKLLHAVWYSGVLELNLTIDDIMGLLGGGEEGGNPLEGFPVEIKALKISAMLPPDISTCWSLHRTRLEVGDLRVDADILFGGLDIQLTLYLALQASFHFTLTPSPAGSAVGIALDSIDTIDVEIADINDDMVGMKGALVSLFRDTLFPMILDQVSAGELFAFTLPRIYVGDLLAGLDTSTLPIPLDLDNVVLQIVLDHLSHEQTGDIFVKGKLNDVTNDPGM